MREIVRQELVNKNGMRHTGLLYLLMATLLVASCNPAKQPQAAYVPISQLEQSYGRLITVSNAPTPQQHGTGDRLGLFRG